MNPSLLVSLALAALLLPVGSVLVLAPVAWKLGADGAQVLGLVLLGVLAGFHGGASSPDPTAADGVPKTTAMFAIELQGRWRHPPGGNPYLVTSAGNVAVRLSSGVTAPQPGRRVVVRARVDVAAVTSAAAESADSAQASASSPARIVRIVSRGDLAGAWLDRWSACAESRLAELLPPDQRGLVGALVLGRRSDLPFEVTRTARWTGTMHLFALSGLHVALVVGLIERLTGALGGRSRLLRLALLAPFVALTGGRPPLVRATTGWILAGLAASRGRATPSLTRLATVALLIGVWQPALADDLSARLSFLAVAGLLSTASLFAGPLLYWGAPIGAFLATAPLVAETFGRVQPWGLVVTPLLVPLVAVLLAIGLVAIVPGPCFSLFDPITAPALSFVADGLQNTLGLLAELCPPPLHPGPLPVPAVAVSLAVVVALAILASQRKHWSSGARAAAATWARRVP